MFAMSIKNLMLALLFLPFTGFTQPGVKWGDQRNGTFVNPVLPADYSDMDAIRVGHDYYAISSTFQFSPGIVILHSKDMVNWTILGHVVNDLPGISPYLNWDKMDRYGRGVWAGSIRFHAGKFWVYFGTPDEGFFMSTATNPAGPWEPLHQVMDAKGWDDCCPFWDDDGKAYFIATHFSDQYKIHLFRMSPDGKSIVMSSDSVIHQSKGSEANKLYKINGLYYHFFSEVKAEGRVTMMGRSGNIYGPYELKQLNHVNKSVDKEPNQGGLIKAPSGKWWFFTHQGTGSWEGRAACLLPVTWINGWPIIGEPGADTIGNMVWNYRKPIQGQVVTTPQTTDEFNTDEMAVQWEWNYQPRDEKWSLKERPGFLRLHAFETTPAPESKRPLNLLYRAGNTLTQRSMRTAGNEVIVQLHLGGMQEGQLAGLCHFSAAYSSLGIKEEYGKRILVYDSNGVSAEGKEVTGSVIWLKSTWDWNGNSWYQYSMDGLTYHSIGGRYQLSWGFYRGDRIGIFTYNDTGQEGFIDVNWFRYKYTVP